MPSLSQSFGLLLLRAGLAVVFIGHGAQKLFGSFNGDGLNGTEQGFDQLGIPLPEIMAPLVGVTEFGGGILLAVGLLTPLAGLALAVTMLVATLTAELEEGFFGAAELTIMLGAAALALVFTGAGRFSIDGVTGLGDRLTRRRASATS